MLSQNAEEILETLWIKTEERKFKSISYQDLNLKVGNRTIKELIDSGSIIISDKDEIKLTDKGRQEGRNVVRRHRLAERLLMDVMDIKGDLMHETACEFEHILYKGIDDCICTLLGHPKVCPHGSAIPKGKCCEKEAHGVSIILPLSRLVPGQTGKIAYIYAEDQKRLQKMIAMGVTPGIEISLLQSFPSFLFKVSNSQFAVDELIASSIFVRLANEEAQNKIL